MPALINLGRIVWIPLLLFGAGGINQEDAQLGDESGETELERHCQLVITAACSRACRPLCSTGAVWAFGGGPQETGAGTQVW